MVSFRKSTPPVLVFVKALFLILRFYCYTSTIFLMIVIRSIAIFTYETSTLCTKCDGAADLLHHIEVRFLT